MFLGALSLRRVETRGVVEFDALTRSQLQKNKKREVSRHRRNTRASSSQQASLLRFVQMVFRLLDALPDTAIEDHRLGSSRARALNLSLDRLHHGTGARHADFFLGPCFDQFDAGAVTPQQ